MKPFLVVPPEQVDEIQEAYGTAADVIASKPLPYLLDASGAPIPKPDPAAAIPFKQWEPKGPIGRSIDRGAAVRAQAQPFLDCGGRYACVFRSDGMAELVAGFEVKGGDKGEMVIVAEEVVPNGPEIGPAVDRLVAASVANLHKLPVTETIQ